MTKYFLDTHTAIWSLTNDVKLSPKARELIADTSVALCVSIVSVWEIAIKVSVGRANFLVNVSSFLELIQENGIEIIGVLPECLGIIETMPFIHRDPFDRLLIATAKSENMTIITADKNIQKYDVNWIW